MEGECLLLVLGWGFFVFKKKKIKKRQQVEYQIFRNYSWLYPKHPLNVATDADKKKPPRG